MVDDPVADVAGVLGHQLEGPRDEVDAVQVERARVPLVHGDEHVGRIRRGDVDEHDPHALEGGQVPGRLRRSVELGHVEVEVLVASLVLDVEDPLAVTAPAPAHDPPDVVVGDARGVVIGPREGPHPHVEPVLLRREVAELGAVGADLAPCPLGVLEEVLDGDEGWGGRGHGVPFVRF